LFLDHSFLHQNNMSAFREQYQGANNDLEDQGLPRFYVIINNVAKKNNVGQMMRSACAFGVREVLIAGSKKNTQYFGAMGTHKHVPVKHFEKFHQAVEYAKQQGCKICGVEIKPEAKSVVSLPFPKGNTAFVLGNEGHGLSDLQCQACDYYVYIPHYGDGTASLNVTVAASIIFQHFAVWAGYPEREREGEKFLVREVPSKQGAEGEDDMKIQKARAEKRLEMVDTQGVNSLFDV